MFPRVTIEVPTYFHRSLYLSSTHKRLAIPTLVSDTTRLSKCLDLVFDVLLNVQIGDPLPLYLDLEGTKLSIIGRISLLTPHVSNDCTSTTLILDIKTLQREAFTTSSTNPKFEPVTPRISLNAVKSQRFSSTSVTTLMRCLLISASC